MATVLLLAGTLGRGLPWWRPGSAFARALQAHGHRLAAPGDAFSWSSALDGLIGANDVWEAEGDHLRRWLADHPVSAIVAHSHGAQVACWALAEGARVSRLVTVGSPVRADMAKVRALARPRVGGWTHCYSPTDLWQLLGTIRDGGGLAAWPRRMPEADVNLSGGWTSHTGLLSPALWDAREWWGAIS